MAVNTLDETKQPNDLTPKFDTKAQKLTEAEKEATTEEHEKKEERPSRNGRGPKICKDFDHGDTTPVKGVESIFNCGSKSGTW